MRGSLVMGGLVSLAMTGAAAAQGSPISGVWLTENADSRIRIAPCGKSHCATVIWAKTGGVDANNPDPALRKRPIVGMALSKDMRPAGDRGYAGSIYNPENGKTYSITMQAKGSNKLEVEGCVLGVLCGSESWSRQREETAFALPASGQD